MKHCRFVGSASDYFVLDRIDDEYDPNQARGMGELGGQWVRAVDMSELKKVGGKLGSNEGGVYEDEHGNRYYIKKPPTKDHVKNELIAADLYKLAGVNTMEYVPIRGGGHVATKFYPLDKNNIKQFNADEIKKAQSDFGPHAWLANWDAAGLGGDNQVVSRGKVTTVDAGGSLRYRAQGGPKGSAFGKKVGETTSFLDMKTNRDSAKLFGSMTNREKLASYERVTKLSDDQIAKVIKRRGGDTDLVQTVIARKYDLERQANALKQLGALDSVPFVETWWDDVEVDDEYNPNQPRGKGAVGGQWVKTPMSGIKGTTAERVAMRKQLQQEKDPQKREELKARILHSFVKQHGKLDPKDFKDQLKMTELEESIEKYSKLYGLPNPLKQSKAVAPPSVIPAHMATPASVAAKYGTAEPKLDPGWNSTSPEEFKKATTNFTPEEVKAYDTLSKLAGSEQTAKSWLAAGEKRRHGTNLTKVEAANIVAYSSNAFKKTNSQLRSGSLEVSTYVHARDLNKSLDKLPGHVGTVYRKADLTDKQFAKYKPGYIAIERGFTSTSTTESTWSGDYRYVIKSKNGRDIKKISSHPSENEVLFKSNTAFRVTKVEGKKIYMEELGDDD